jgi:NADH-quinone oxidoreductase subunit G
VPTITIDNQPYAIPEGDRSLLEVCLSLGFDLPYFCWHPAMHSVGACRQCAVKVFKDAADTRGRIVMSCMTAARDGMRISIADPEAAGFRARVIEWLMVNHPHDCPICDEGGECHLQDMTVMTGQVNRRYRFTKRTHRDQDLGPFVNMEMNRCIQCYRCVRFYRDYAGGRDFGAMGWHDHVFFGRHADGALQSEFSGNLVEVCPTGVFTDKTLKKHYTRKWDLAVSPSVCVHCGLGCNVIPAERYGALRRVRARFNAQVNGYFLCDRGRYGYEYAASPNRIRQPLARDEDGVLKPVSKSEAIAIARRMLAGGRAVGIGSGRASLESNFALSALAGVEHFVHCATWEETRLAVACVDILRLTPCRTPSLREVESADAVFVLGEDVTNSAPMLALAIRQAVRNRPRKIGKDLRIPDWDDASIRLAMQRDMGPLYIATPTRTKLDELAAGTFRAAPDDLARLAFAVAHAIDPAAPDVPDLPQPARALAARIACDLAAAEKPLVISGPSCGNLAMVRAAANVASALARKGMPALLSLTSWECNSVGLAMMCGTAEPAVEILRRGQANTLVIVEGDPFRHMDRHAADELLAAAKNVIVIDHTLTPTAERAHLVLPAAALGEADGTFVNNEGRAQRFYKAFVPAGAIQDSWKWLTEITDPSGVTISDERTTAPTIDELHASMAVEAPDFAHVRDIAPPAGFRQVGQRIPRQPHRYSGRTAMNADVSVHEPKPPQDSDAPLSFSMEGYQGRPPAPLLANYWSPGWNSVQAINKFQIEVGGELHGGDPGRRLIEPWKTWAGFPNGEAPPPSDSDPADTPAERPWYEDEIPSAFTARDGLWWGVPVQHIFGSDELSAMAPAIAGLAPRPYVAISPPEASRAALKDGQHVQLSLGGRSWPVTVRLDDSLPAGVAAVPSGLPGMCGLELPAWATIAAEKNS